MSGSKNICVLGGSGFVGQRIVEYLAKQGHSIKILTRHRERKRDLLVLPTVKIVSADVHDPHALKEHFTGQDAVINLIGILNESGNRTFRRVHVELARKVGDACVKKQVPRLLHMSALNADVHGPSKYLRSKGEAEKYLHNLHDVNVTSFQPSVIFGPRDDFFNRFVKLLSIPPRLAPFPLACAKAKFAPVYVDDVANAFTKSLNDNRTYGQRYQLCGPKNYTLLELVIYTSNVSGIIKHIVPLGDTASKLQGKIMGVLPGKPFTMDNYLSTTIDSVCDECFPSLFDINPTPIESVVPYYLGKQALRDRYTQYRKNAHRD